MPIDMGESGGVCASVGESAGEHVGEDARQEGCRAGGEQHTHAGMCGLLGDGRGGCGEPGWCAAGWQ